MERLLRRSCFSRRLLVSLRGAGAHGAIPHRRGGRGDDEEGGLEAARARANFGRWPNAEIFAGDGSDTHGSHDAILVNAGATHPRAEWLEALRPGGRLLLPLTVSAPAGAMPMLQVPYTNPGMLLLARDSEARFMGPIYIFDCAGARDPELEPALRSALFGGRWKDVRRLRRDAHAAGPDCIVHGAWFCLSA